MKTLNDYVVEKTLKWSEYKESELSDYYSGNYMPFNIDYGTDIFNKSSRTTTCFDNSSGEIVMYCENCNETHVNKTDMLLELQILSEDSKRLSPTRIICEECGSSYDINDIRKISRPWKLKDSCTRLVYDTIYDDNNGIIKLSIKICTMMVNKKFFSVDNKYKLIFNTITGQTYVYEDIQNKKNKIRPLHLKSCLSNMTYNAYRFDYILEKTLIDTDDKNKYIVDIFKKMYDKLYKKISHNLGYNPTTLEDYAKEYEIKNDEHIYNAKVLALYNRFPNLNPFFLISKYNNRDIPYLNFDNSVVVLTKMRKVKNTSKNPIKELLELYKVSDIEFFESYIKDNPSKLSQLVYFSKFIKNKYLIKDLLEIDESPSICDSEESVNELLKIKHSDKYCVTQFFKHISKEATEDEICDIIKNCFYNHNNKESFKNICKHYHIAKKINPKTKINFKRIKDLLIGDSYAHSIDSRWITDIIKDDLINSIYNNYKKKFNFKINTLDEFCEEAMSKSIGFNAYSLNILQIYQCNPTFNPYVLAKMLNINDYDLYSFNDNAFSGITSLNPLSTDVLGDLFKFYNIPNVKSLKKIVMNHPKSFSNLVFYASIFKDVNVLNNIMSKKCFVETNNMSYVELVIFNHNI